MSNKSQGILALIAFVLLIGVYFIWDATKNDGQMTLTDANPNAPALTQPAAPGGAPANPTGNQPAPTPQQ
ncbi:hypothetical protein [Flaviflagellibacter deserti]|uniref:Membrane protein insertase YidC n=1 Tax=Flaviflagellibacter deserti TaxID=2267266 RepID=A0ABV9Z1P0_9HYPH